MNRRTFIKTLSSTALLALAPRLGAENAKLFSNKSMSMDVVRKTSQKPNIIIIMADDLGYGDIGCYGSTQYSTPNLNALAAAGMKFTDYHSNGAVCSPTRAALLTGQYQQRSGVEGVITAANNRDDGMPLAKTTFAELLKQQGYATALFGKWHLGYKVDFNPTNQGFDEFIGFVSGNVDYVSHIDQAKYDDWWHGKNLQPETGYTTHLITQHGLDFIERNKENSFCLYLAQEAPHSPYQGPDDPPIRLHNKPDRSQTVAEKKAAYKEMIESMDQSVGDIVNKIKQLGLETNTFIFFCSDNGPSTYGTAGPLKGKKGSVWEGGHRVPAIAYWPGIITPSTVNNQTIIGIDLMPTMASIAGVESLEQLNLDGINFLPTLVNNNTPLPERTLFWRHNYNLKAVRKANWKLVETPDITGLYNLETDLDESNNLASSNTQKRQELQNSLAAWEAQFN